MGAERSRPTIYTASRTKHAYRWRALRERGWPIIASWIDEAGEGETSDWADLWTRCMSEAVAADVLIVYAEPGETLRGAILEAGARLSAGKEVIYVGPAGVLNNILRHPGLCHVPSLADALGIADALDRNPAPHPPEPASVSVPPVGTQGREP